MQPMKKWAGILILALMPCLQAGAQTIRDIDMQIVLHQNGDASVTQVWQVNVYQGTEWYVPIGSTRGYGMTLNGLTVYENGREFISEGRNWNVNRDREGKAWRSGIVDKSDGGMELCWGVGSDGDHTWTVNYNLEGLVQSFDECDGWGFQFLGDEYEEPAQHVKAAHGDIGTQWGESS